MKPKLSLQELVDAGTDDGSDYCDGDHAGYHNASFANGVLTLSYVADDEYSEYESTSAQFVEIGALRDALGDAMWRGLLASPLGTEICLPSPSGASDE